MSSRMSQTLGRLRTMMAGFTPGQRGVVLVGALALVLGAFALTRWVAQPTWAPLYGNLSGSDANAIVEQLRSSGVSYKLADGGQTVLVPQAQVYDMRVQLSGKDLPSGDAQGGYSLLDKQGITATDFQQNVAYRRALEGELSKTLQAMDGVQTAVVHLALPKKDVFATEQDKPTASVLVQLGAGKTLTRDQVQAVSHLVGGSVEGLNPDDVTITDSAGHLLSFPDGGAGAAAAVAGQTDQQTAQYEQRADSQLQALLDQVLGPGKSAVQTSATLDFDAKDTTSERYLPQASVSPSSEESLEEQYTSSGSGTGGTLGQTFPTLSASGAANGGQYSKKQVTRNNPQSKVVERIQAAPGSVKRLTVAVAIDAKTATALTPAQMSSLQTLVSNAVGLDTKRGDALQITALPFDTTAATKAAAELKAAEAAQKQEMYLQLGKKAGIGLLVVIALILLLRRRPKRAVTATASDLPSYGNGMLVHSPAPAAIEAGGAGSLGSAEDALSIAERERVREQVAHLVDNQPEELAQVIQGWLAERGT